MVESEAVEAVQVTTHRKLSAASEGPVPHEAERVIRADSVIQRGNDNGLMVGRAVRCRRVQEWVEADAVRFRTNRGKTQVAAIDENVAFAQHDFRAVGAQCDGVVPPVDVEAHVAQSYDLSAATS